MEVDSQKVADVSVGKVFGDISVFDAGLSTFPFDDFLPKFAKGIHCIVF
jgi:hypothetical protein